MTETPPSRTYAIPDLHGRFDLLRLALERIAADAAGAPYTVVTLGDYVDRGPESRLVIEGLMGHDDAAFRLVCLRGNHEGMMFAAIVGEMRPAWWLSNGGAETLLSYGHPTGGAYRPSVVPRAHTTWMIERPCLYRDEFRVYVHADIDETKPLAEQNDELLTWGRRKRDEDVAYPGLYVVHGHTPFDDGPVILAGRCNLDTRAWKTGRLCVGVFRDDVPGGPIDVLIIEGEPA